MKSRIGKTTIYILALIPFILWLTIPPISARISDADTIYSSIGQIAGLVGMTAFALSLILSGRFKFMEKYFGGLNNMYKVHHEIGGYSLILLIIHPLSLAISYGYTSFLNILSFLLPYSNWQKNLGSISLLLLFILLFITFYTKLPYQIWKWTHKFLGLAFFLGSIHAIFIGSDISKSGLLKYYLLTLSIVAIAVYLYRTVFWRLTIKRYKYSIANILSKGDVYIIDLKPLKEKLSFISGQFIFISFEQRGFPSESHPFSIVSAQNEDTLKLGIKALGDFTRKLSNLKQGTIAQIEGPFGMFSYKKAQNKKQVWIAGGIGITPFVSMAKTIPNGEYDIDLYYCINTQEEAIFMDELQNVAKTNNRLKIIPWISKEKGYLTLDALKINSGNLVDKEYFLCGPQGMMKNIKTQLNNQNISLKNIHSEEFAY